MTLAILILDQVQSQHSNAFLTSMNPTFTGTFVEIFSSAAFSSVNYINLICLFLEHCLVLHKVHDRKNKEQ